MKFKVEYGDLAIFSRFLKFVGVGPRRCGFSRGVTRALVELRLAWFNSQGSLIGSAAPSIRPLLTLSVFIGVRTDFGPDSNPFADLMFLSCEELRGEACSCSLPKSREPATESGSDEPRSRPFRILSLPLEADISLVARTGRTGRTGLAKLGLLSSALGDDIRCLFLEGDSGGDLPTCPRKAGFGEGWGLVFMRFAGEMLVPFVFAPFDFAGGKVKPAVFLAVSFGFNCLRLCADPASGSRSFVGTASGGLLSMTLVGFGETGPRWKEHAGKCSTVFS